MSTHIIKTDTKEITYHQVSMDISLNSNYFCDSSSKIEMGDDEKRELLTIEERGLLSSDEYAELISDKIDDIYDVDVFIDHDARKMLITFSYDEYEYADLNRYETGIIELIHSLEPSDWSKRR